ncbi:glycoside hydrolase family 5 protein [bacterium]
MKPKYQITFHLLITIIPLLILGACNKTSTSSDSEPSYSMSALHTDGRWIKNDQGEKVLLRGVNIPGLEWDANESHVLESFNIAINEWGCNLIRLPLSQDRWYGFGPEQNDTGVRYRGLVDQLVDLSLAKEIYLWLDLHWNNAGHWGQYIGQHLMPDSLSSIFWSDIAKRYKNHPAVLFGLYNEPHDISWDIWKNGGIIDEYYDRSGTPADLTYNAIGHQQLTDEIRALGADNLIVVAGLDWGFDLSGILNGYALEGENIVYDTHPYPWKDANWNYRWGAVGDSLALIVGEWGGSEEHETYFIRLRQYMRDHQFSWAAWCFHADAGPQMISDWSYTPTYFGAIAKMELNTEIDLNAEN